MNSFILKHGLLYNNNNNTGFYRAPMRKRYKALYNHSKINIYVHNKSDTGTIVLQAKKIKSAEILIKEIKFKTTFKIVNTVCTADHQR